MDLRRLEEPLDAGVVLDRLMLSLAAADDALPWPRRLAVVRADLVELGRILLAGEVEAEMAADAARPELAPEAQGLMAEHEALLEDVEEMIGTGAEAGGMRALRPRVGALLKRAAAHIAMEDRLALRAADDDLGTAAD
jgi:hypothetical protein